MNLKKTLMRKKILEMCNYLTQDMYEGSSGSVKNVCEVTEFFNVREDVLYGFTVKTSSL